MYAVLWISNQWPLLLNEDEYRRFMQAPRNVLEIKIFEYRQLNYDYLAWLTLLFIPDYQDFALITQQVYYDSYGQRICRKYIFSG